MGDDGDCFVNENPMTARRKVGSERGSGEANKADRELAGASAAKASGGAEGEESASSWERALDETSGVFYFFHKETHEVRWDSPIEVKKF